MHGPSWIALLRRIPIHYHDSLAFSLTSGSEIVVQCLLRLERDFVILRGRLAGSQDAGRVLILPYGQIVSVAVQRRITDAEANAIFEQPLDIPASAHASTQATEDTALDMHPVTFASLGEVAAAASADAAEPAAAPEPALEPEEAASGAAKFKGKLPSKSILLARLRARLAEQGK